MAKDSAVENALKMIKDKDVKYVDLRFTDPRGKMQHLTMDVSQMHAEAWEEGLMFDGSSIAGWKAINESDMILRPDASSVTLDPFYAQTPWPCSATSPIRGRAKVTTRPAFHRQAHRGLSQVDQDR